MRHRDLYRVLAVYVAVAEGWTPSPPSMHALFYPSMQIAHRSLWTAAACTVGATSSRRMNGRRAMPRCCTSDGGPDASVGTASLQVTDRLPDGSAVSVREASAALGGGGCSIVAAAKSLLSNSLGSDPYWPYGSMPEVLYVCRTTHLDNFLSVTCCPAAGPIVAGRRRPF